MSSRKLSPEQAEKNRERVRVWYRVPGNKERSAATKRARCEEDPEKCVLQKREAGARFRENHREEINASLRERRAEYRQQVIEAYGGRCNCPGCHVNHDALLTVDHVNGDASHRQNRRSTRDIYAQIIREGFPETYQLLCGSCNLAKSNRATCPMAGVDH